LPNAVHRSLALVALDEVTLFGNTGVVVSETRQALIRPRGGRDFVTYHDFKLMPTARVRKEGANYFNMVGSYRGHEHFFHFLFDRLPRLYYLLEKFPLGRERVVVLTNEKLPAFQRDIYRFVAARHPNVRFEAVPERERWVLPRLFHLDDFQPIKRTLASAGALAFMRRLVFDGYAIATNQKPSLRLYVTRADTKKRRVTNEAELMTMLAARGFASVAPGRLPLREQAALFAQAEIVAGAHGAGLTNILFAPHDAGVVEIFPADKVKNTYFLLAKSLGQNYRGVIGSSGNRREWFSVAARQVEQAVEGLP
jgi:capsular polysaccharide biosynthesis protein